MHKGPKIEKTGEKLGHFRVPKTLTFVSQSPINRRVRVRERDFLIRRSARP